MRPELKYLILGCERQSVVSQGLTSGATDRTYQRLHGLTYGAALNVPYGSYNRFWRRHVRDSHNRVVLHNHLSDFISALRKLHQAHPEFFPQDFTPPTNARRPTPAP